MKNKIKFSFAITVCNEEVDIDCLLMHLEMFLKKTDYEIIILYDKGNTTEEVKSVVNKYRKILNIKTYEHKLNNDFATHKNFLDSKCSGEYIVNIDADELPTYKLLDDLDKIVDENRMIEGFMVPRINIVEDITEEDIQKWGWVVNEMGYINWPDYQLRIYKNVDYLKWSGKVHETKIGYKVGIKLLPQNYNYCFKHVKNIDRQRKQNKMYKNITDTL